MAVHYVSDLQESNPGPGIMAPSSRVNGKLRSSVLVQSFTAASVNEAGDVIALAKVPSGATVIEFMIGGVAQGAGGLFDFGVCDRNGGNVSPSGTDSRERFHNALDVSAGFANTNRRFTTFAEDTVAQPLWQLMGWTADPAREWFVCLRVQAPGATPDGANMQSHVRYAND